MKKRSGAFMKKAPLFSLKQHCATYALKMTIYRQTVEIQIHFSYTMFEAEGRNMQIEIKIDNSCKETKVSEIWKTDDQ